MCVCVITMVYCRYIFLTSKSGKICFSPMRTTNDYNPIYMEQKLSRLQSRSRSRIWTRLHETLFKTTKRITLFFIVQPLLHRNPPDIGIQLSISPSRSSVYTGQNFSNQTTIWIILLRVNGVYVLFQLAMQKSLKCYVRTLSS